MWPIKPSDAGRFQCASRRRAESHRRSADSHGTPHDQIGPRSQRQADSGEPPRPAQSRDRAEIQPQAGRRATGRVVGPSRGLCADTVGDDARAKSGGAGCRAGCCARKSAVQRGRAERRRRVRPGPRRLWPTSIATTPSARAIARTRRWSPSRRRWGKAQGDGLSGRQGGAVSLRHARPNQNGRSSPSWAARRSPTRST